MIDGDTFGILVRKNALEGRDDRVCPSRSIHKSVTVLFSSSPSRLSAHEHNRDA